MTEQELQKYFEERKMLFTHPDMMDMLEKKVNNLLQVTEFNLLEKALISWTLELLCFTLHTGKGKDMYIKLLNHAGKHSGIIAERYWKVYDNQENLIERYNIKPCS